MSDLRHIAQVLAIREVAHRHFRMELQAPGIAATARAGHFVHILPRPSQNSDPLLRRAFSILSVNSDNIEVLFRVEGKGTAALAAAAPGNQLDLLGPLGVPFAPMPRRAILVGGGVGVPPMAMLAAQRGRDPHDGGEAVALIGARSASEIICREDFDAHGVPLEVATDDGSAGHHGFVTHLLETQLREQPDPATVVYACGPLPMLRAVAAICQTHGVRCQVSLEENMPCGIGVCNGCVVPVQGAGDDYGHYRRICIEGPVLWADQVNWSHYETN